MKKLFFLLFLLVAVTACGQTKQSYLADFEKFVNDIKHSAEQYKDSDWVKADHQFADFKETYKKHSNELTAAEKTEIAKLDSAYTALKIKKVGNEMKEGIDDTIEKVKDAAKEGAKDVKEGAQKVIKKSKKAIEKAKSSVL